jgi:hypothetical protein
MTNQKKSLLGLFLFFSSALCPLEQTPPQSPFTNDSIEKALCLTYSQVTSEYFCNAVIYLTNEIRQSHGLTDLSGKEPIMLQIHDTLYEKINLSLVVVLKGNINAKEKGILQKINITKTKLNELLQEFYDSFLATVTSDKTLAQQFILSSFLKHSQYFFVYWNQIMVALEEMFTDSILADINANKTDKITKNNPLVLAFMDELKPLCEIDKQNKKLQIMFSKFWQDQAGQFIPSANNPFIPENKLAIKLISSAYSKETAAYCKDQALEFVNNFREKNQRAPLNGEESVITECTEKISQLLCPIIKMFLKEQFKLNVIMQVVELKDILKQCFDASLAGVASDTEIIDALQLHYANKREQNYFLDLQKIVYGCKSAITDAVIQSVDSSREDAGLEPLKAEEKHNLDLVHELQTMFEYAAINAKLLEKCTSLWKDLA